MVSSLSVGITIYIQYRNFIFSDATNDLRKLGSFIEQQYPVLADVEKFESEYSLNTDNYLAMVQEIKELSGVFNLPYIYYNILKTEHNYRDTLEIIYLNIDDTPRKRSVLTLPTAFYQNSVLLRQNIRMQGHHSVTNYSGQLRYTNFMIRKLLVPYHLRNQIFNVLWVDMIPKGLYIAYGTEKIQINQYKIGERSFVTLFHPVVNKGRVAGVLALDYNLSYIKGLQNKAFAVLALAFLIALIMIVFSLILSGRITKPIENLTEKVKKIGGGDFGTKINIQGSDEIAELGNAFNKMGSDLKAYMENLEKVTTEKESINKELGLASEIQHNMLPRIFPVFSSHPMMNLYAEMESAKEVGGDFYDFFYLNPAETKIVFVIADVSGKGVPAALFMVIAKILIKQQMLVYGDPAIVLDKVNKILCADNPECMFVTAFVCVLDLQNGEMTYSNGGHIPPILAEHNNSFNFLKIKKGIAPGMIEWSKYTLCSVKLNAGDKLYLYTDGVNEAMNPKGEQYGYERLIMAANTYRDLEPKEFDEAIRRDIVNFCGGEAQSDDITSVVIEYLGNKEKKQTEEKTPHFGKELTLPASTNELQKLLNWISGIFHAESIGLEIINKMAVVIEEIFINIANYAYPADKTGGTVIVRVSLSKEEFIAQFEDEGLAFNPLEHSIPDVALHLEKREIGGLGVFLVRKWTDKVEYTRCGEKNILTIYKNLKKTPDPSSGF
ncbi:MAG: SpoIIE family protein phosphatase [Spirochaetaceae bacterium]|jgi:sigma-B regulation protein RsbU (phosphoserine phosphatase)|nr:SpoIIE family protein phosphatase [Spirochaetaceae bacterium]